MVNFQLIQFFAFQKKLAAFSFSPKFTFLLLLRIFHRFQLTLIIDSHVLFCFLLFYVKDDMIYDFKFLKSIQILSLKFTASV